MASDKLCHCPNIMKGDVFSLPFRLSPVKERLVIQNCQHSKQQEKNTNYIKRIESPFLLHCTLKRINLQELS